MISLTDVFMVHFEMGLQPESQFHDLLGVDSIRVAYCLSKKLKIKVEWERGWRLGLKCSFPKFNLQQSI